MSYYTTTYGNLTIPTNYTINTTGAWSSAKPQNVAISSKLLQLDEDADIRFGDASLMETLREIKTQLGMLTPDPTLESEFDELRVCAQEYERLRTKFLEQKRVWDALKQQTF